MSDKNNSEFTNSDLVTQLGSREKERKAVWEALFSKYEQISLLDDKELMISELDDEDGLNEVHMQSNNALTDGIHNSMDTSTSVNREISLSFAPQPTKENRRNVQCIPEKSIVLKSVIENQIDEDINLQSNVSLNNKTEMHTINDVPIASNFDSNKKDLTQFRSRCKSIKLYTAPSSPVSLKSDENNSTAQTYSECQALLSKGHNNTCLNKEFEKCTPETSYQDYNSKIIHCFTSDSSTDGTIEIEKCHYSTIASNDIDLINTFSNRMKNSEQQIEHFDNECISDTLQASNLMLNKEHEQLEDSNFHSKKLNQARSGIIKAKGLGKVKKIRRSNVKTSSKAIKDRSQSRDVINQDRNSKMIESNKVPTTEINCNNVVANNEVFTFSPKMSLDSEDQFKKNNNTASIIECKNNNKLRLRNRNPRKNKKQAEKSSKCSQGLKNPTILKRKNDAFKNKMKSNVKTNNSVVSVLESVLGNEYVNFVTKFNNKKSTTVSKCFGKKTLLNNSSKERSLVQTVSEGIQKNQIPETLRNTLIYDHSSHSNDVIDSDLIKNNKLSSEEVEMENNHGSESTNSTILMSENNYPKYGEISYMKKNNLLETRSIENFNATDVQFAVQLPENLINDDKSLGTCSTSDSLFKNDEKFTMDIPLKSSTLIPIESSDDDDDHSDDDCNNGNNDGDDNDDDDFLKLNEIIAEAKRKSSLQNLFSDLDDSDTELDTFSLKNEKLDSRSFMPGFSKLSR